MGAPKNDKMYKVLEKFSCKILKQLEELKVKFDFKILSPKSCIIVNSSARKILLMTINALDEKNKQVLAFGITFRKSSWEQQLKNSSEMELMGKLSNGAFKSITSGKIVDFIS